MPHVHGFRTRQRIDIPGASRFLTFSTHARAHLFDDPIRNLQFVHALARFRESGLIELHAWALMSNHVHLLLTPALHALPLDPWMSKFRESVANRLARVDRSVGEVWCPGGGYDRTIFSCGEFKEKRQYILMNGPKAIGRSEPSEWYWHSWQEWSGSGREGFPRIDPMDAERLMTAREVWRQRRG
ncbi:MAG: transposase [Planctomycetota bacterium]